MPRALFRRGIEVKDYQLDPALRPIQMPRVNLLIADDVKLGKKIEAGRVLQELVDRHRARRSVVVCPASLQAKWYQQMRETSGLPFRIVGAEPVGTGLPDCSRPTTGKRLLTRHRGLMQARPSFSTSPVLASAASWISTWPTA